MILEVLCRDKGYSMTLYIHSRLDKYVASCLPFNTKARFWKEELYFETPITIMELKGLRGVSVIDYGKLYYWPPGRALCIFYGLSEPYTTVYEVGYLVSNPHYSLVFEDGDELVVQQHKPDETYSDIASILQNLGFTVTTPLQDGVRVIAACKFINNIYLSVNIYREDYGIHIESNPILKYDRLYPTLKTLRMVKKTLRNKYKFARLDLNEDDYTVITAITDNINELSKAIREVEKAYIEALNLLELK